MKTQNTREDAPDEGAFVSVPVQQDRVQQAAALLKKYHSCCTAVFATYAPKLGIDETLAARLTQGMPGMGYRAMYAAL